MNNQHNILGQKGEEAAAKFLKLKGLTILERNWKLGDLETDIIAQDGQTIVFVEVKTRTGGGFKPPEAAVDRERQTRLTAGAQAYLKHKKTDNPWRFDIIAIEVFPERMDINHIEDAFLPSLKTIKQNSYSGQSRWQTSKSSTRARSNKRKS